MSAQPFIILFTFWEFSFVSVSPFSVPCKLFCTNSSFKCFFITVHCVHSKAVFTQSVSFCYSRVTGYVESKCQTFLTELLSASFSFFFVKGVFPLNREECQICRHKLGYKKKNGMIKKTLRFSCQILLSYHADISLQPRPLTFKSLPVSTRRLVNLLNSVSETFLVTFQSS